MHYDKDAKKEAFKSLLCELLKESTSEEHPMKEMMGEMGEEAPMKATIMAEDEKGLIEGAKALPKALSKAEEYMKGEMGSLDDIAKKKKKKKKKEY